MADRIITNNPLVMERFADSLTVEYRELSREEILTIVRDRVHTGGRLLTHPLAGGVKPGETPFISVMISDGPGPLDLDSLKLIEEGIAARAKFAVRDAGLTESVRSDYMEIDLALISGALRHGGTVQ